MKKKLSNMTLSSYEILNNSEKKSIKGGIGHQDYSVCGVSAIYCTSDRLYYCNWIDFEAGCSGEGHNV